MYSFVALLSCLAVASASKCCIPPQWEGIVGFLTGIIHNGKVQVSKGSGLMAYDGVRRIIGQIEYVDVGNTGNMEQVDVLMDYDADTKYIRHNGKCIKTKLNQVWSDGCIPDNVTETATNSVLGFGDNSVLVNSYSTQYDGVDISYGVTASGCIPVLEQVRGTLQGNRFMENMVYLNITAGISDPTTLNSPPVGCENAEMVSAHYTDGMFNTGMIGRKRSVFGF